MTDLAVQLPEANRRLDAGERLGPGRLPELLHAFGLESLLQRDAAAGPSAELEQLAADRDRSDIGRPARLGERDAKCGPPFAGIGLACAVVACHLVGCPARSDDLARIRVDKQHLRGLGRAGAGARCGGGHRARRDERGAECGRAGIVGRGTHAAAVRVSAGGALQRVGRREFGSELQLPLT